MRHLTTTTHPSKATSHVCSFCWQRPFQTRRPAESQAPSSCRQPPAARSGVAPRLMSSPCAWAWSALPCSLRGVTGSTNGTLLSRCMHFHTNIRKAALFQSWQSSPKASLKGVPSRARTRHGLIQESTKPHDHATLPETVYQNM